MFEIFTYSFITNTMLAAIFTSIIVGIVGTYIVARRRVFLSGGITHASFGGIGIAYYLGLNPILGATVFSILSAVGIDYLSQKSEIRHDSMIGLWWAGGMSVGVLFIYITPGYVPNLMSYLFGSILTVTSLDVWLLAALSVVVIVFFALYHRIVMYLAFDSNYALSQKIPINIFSHIVNIIVALTIVFSIKVSGIILVISLLTAPQSIVNLFTLDYKKIMVFSILVAFVSIFVGLLISFYVDIPSGATIILSLIVFYAIAKLISILYTKFKLQKA